MFLTAKFRERTLWASFIPETIPVPDRLYARAVVMLCLIWLAGCATAPPVQEMSDARQAIAAAREAGAGDLAPAQLREAELMLGTAEDFLQSGSSAGFWQAKKAALGAKEKAFEALLTSRNARQTSD